MSGFYDIKARSLNGDVVSMDKYKGKVVLIENTASLWGTTVRDFTQMNELCDKVPLWTYFLVSKTYHVDLIIYLWREKPLIKPNKNDFGRVQSKTFVNAKKLQNVAKTGLFLI